jgi:PDZ domain
MSNPNRIVVAAIALAQPLFAAELERPSLPDLISNRSVAYVGIDIERGATQWESLDLVRLYRDEEVAGFLAPLIEMGSSQGETQALLAIKFFAAQYGFPAVFDGKVEIGVVGHAVRIDGGEPTWIDGFDGVSFVREEGQQKWVDPEFVVMIDTAGQESFGPTFERVLELEPSIRRDGDVIGALEYHSAIFPNELTGGRGELAIHFTFVNDVFLLAMRPERLLELVEGLRAGAPRPDSLANDSSFKRWRTMCARGSELLEIYVGTKPAMGSIRDFGRLAYGGSEETGSPIERLGLDRIEGFGFRLALENGRLADTIALIGPQQRVGLLRMLDAIQPGSAIVENLRTDSAFHAELRLDPALAFETFLATLDQVDPIRRGEIDESLADASAELGVDIKQALITSVGADVYVSGTMPRSGFIPDVVGALELRDAAKFQAALPALRNAIETESKGGITFADLALKDGDPGFYLKMEGSTVAPSFAIRNGKLLFALTTSGLKKLLLNLAKGEPQTGNANDDLKACLATTIGNDVGSVAGIFYFDLKTAAEFGLAMAEQFLPMMLSQLPVPLDMTKFPAPETVSSYLSGVLYTVRFSDGVLALDGSSPFGGVVVPLGALTAVGIQEALSQRAQEEFEREREEAIDPNQPFVGVLHDPAKSSGGVYVSGITAGSPAAEGGLMEGDVILAVDGMTVTNSADYQRLLKAKKPGDEVRYRVERGDLLETVYVIVGRRGDYIR